MMAKIFVAPLVAFTLFNLLMLFIYGNKIAETLKAATHEERAKAVARAASARDLLAAMPTAGAAGLHLPIGSVYGVVFTSARAKAWAARARAKAGAKKSD